MSGSKNFLLQFPIEDLITFFNHFDIEEEGEEETEDKVALLDGQSEESLLWLHTMLYLAGLEAHCKVEWETGQKNRAKAFNEGIDVRHLFYGPEGQLVKDLDPEPFVDFCHCGEFHTLLMIKIENKLDQLFPVLRKYPLEMFLSASPT